MSDPTVLVLPGAGDPSSVWSVVSDAVNNGGVSCEVIEYPMKGVAIGPQPTSIERYGRWTLSEIERRDMSGVVLAGHSMGALIAIELAAMRSPRVSGIVAICPAEPMFVHPSLLEAAEQDPEKAATMIARWSYSPASQETLKPLISRHVAATTALDQGVLAIDLHACNNYQNASTAAERITVPTTIVLSGDDHMTPRSNAELLVDRFSDPEVHVLEGSGHAVAHERPEDIAAIIVAAASRTKDSSGAGIPT